MTQGISPEEEAEMEAAMSMPATRRDIFQAMNLINNAVVAITNHSMAASSGTSSSLKAKEDDMLRSRIMLSEHLTDFIMQHLTPRPGR